MMSKADLVALVSESKDLILDQTFTDLSKKFNTSGVSFDAVEGLGDNIATNSAVLINTGGYPDQRIKGVLNYPPPTIAGGEQFGVMCRVLSLDSSNATYYYARVNSGFAKITRVLNGTFTTLTSAAFALAQSANVAITMTAVGDLISATFDAGGAPATVNLSVIDNQIARRGCMGFRSSSSTVWCRSLEWGQL